MSELSAERIQAMQERLANYDAEHASFDDQFAFMDFAEVDLRDVLTAYLALRDRLQAIETCTCEIDRHDFDCPMHNDRGPSRRGPNGDEL